MTFTYTTPASRFDLAELAGPGTMLSWQVLREMARGGPTWSAFGDGELIAICGIYPIEDSDAGEAWFRFAPNAPRYMLPIVRAIRLTIRTAGYRSVVVICRSAIGVRIARAAGFAFAEQSELGEIWIWKPLDLRNAATVEPRHPRQRNGDRLPSRRPRSNRSSEPASPNSHGKKAKPTRQDPAAAAESEGARS